MSSTVHSTLLVAVDQLFLGHQHLFGLSFCRLGYSLGWQPQLLGALEEKQHGLGRPKSHPSLDVQHSTWIHPRCLGKTHMKACPGDFFTCFSHIEFLFIDHLGNLKSSKTAENFKIFQHCRDFSGNLMEFLFFCSSFFETVQAWLWCWANL